MGGATATLRMPAGYWASKYSGPYGNSSQAQDFYNKYGGTKEDYEKYMKSQMDQKLYGNGAAGNPYYTPGATSGVPGSYAPAGSYSGINQAGTSTTGQATQFQMPRELQVLFDRFNSKSDELYNQGQNLKYNADILPNLTAGEYRGAGSSQAGQDAKRALIGSGVDPNSLTFKREMDKVGREREASIYDAVAQAKMGKSAFDLDKLNALTGMISGDTNMANVLSDYYTKSSSLGLENIWNAINRGDYLTLLQDIFSLP